ncbi:MAG: DMT family transporter [Acidimicrobiales bacterium]|nr:DMT family transporter [Acidimicrobiales bacterium]
MARDATTVPTDARPSSVRMLWVTAVLGACFVFIRAGLGDIPVLWFAALRALLGGMVLVGLGLGQRLRLPRGFREWAVVAGLGLANATIGGAAMYLGTVHLATGIASVVANAQPLLIILPAWALYAERPTRRTTIGLSVGFVGLVVVAIPGGGGSGAPLELIAAAGATAGTLIARRLGTLDNVVAGGWSFLLGGAALAMWAGLDEGVPTIRWSLGFVGILAFLSVLGTAAVYVAWFKEARRCPLYRLTAWTFAVPLFGLVLSVAVEGERPSPWTAAGLTVVLVSMLLVVRGGNRPAPNTTAGLDSRDDLAAIVLEPQPTGTAAAPMATAAVPLPPTAPGDRSGHGATDAGSRSA